jgi:hypothetical protein
MILEIATALAIGTYVALSKDVERTTLREPFPPPTLLPLNSANPPAPSARTTTTLNRQSQLIQTRFRAIYKHHATASETHAENLIIVREQNKRLISAARDYRAAIGIRR